MDRKCTQKHLQRTILLFLALFLPLFVLAQNGDYTVDALVKMGFENVSWAENGEERVYLLENNVYRTTGVGIGVALDEIQKTGMPEDGKTCRLIVLNNNVPMISLCCNTDELKGKEATRHDWNVSYDLGDGWDLVKGEKRKNSSLYKVDFLVYPEFSFKNVKLSVMYEFLINAAPALEVSLWKGSKLSAQVIVPILNQYGYKYDDVRPGFVTLSQRFRLPFNIFVTGTIGTFNNNRWGADLKVEHFFKNERFSVDGRFSYTGWGEWGEYWLGENMNPFRYGYDKSSMIFTGSVGAS